MGKGECPFGISCFYKHQYEDGTLQDRSLGSLRYNMNGQLIDLQPSHPLFEMLRHELEEGGRIHTWQREQQRLRNLGQSEISAVVAIDELEEIIDGLLEMGVPDTESEYDEEDWEDDQIGNFY